MCFGTKSTSHCLHSIFYICYPLHIYVELYSNIFTVVWFENSSDICIALCFDQKNFFSGKMNSFFQPSIKLSVFILFISMIIYDICDFYRRNVFISIFHSIWTISLICIYHIYLLIFSAQALIVNMY